MDEIQEQLDNEAEEARIRAINRSRAAIDYHQCRIKLIEGMTAREFDEYSNFDPYATTAVSA